MMLNKIINSVRESDPDFVVLLGPTAIGKTKLSIDLALELDAEILSIDSRMVYRSMDIGTSKPTTEERRGVIHHMIDLVNPDEPFSVSDYKDLAYKKIEEIKKKGKLPLFVGGTMMYIDAICENWMLGNTAPDNTLREELESLSTEQLYQRLREVDLVQADKADSKNRRHIMRPLEVSILSGKPYSQTENKSEKKYSFLKIGMTMEREKLYRQINERVLDQINMGLLAETKGLARRHNYSLPSMTGLGYKQMGCFLKKEMSFEEAVETLQKDTRNFAKRQRTWWKKDDTICYF